MYIIMHLYKIIMYYIQCNCNIHYVLYNVQCTLCTTMTMPSYSVYGYYNGPLMYIAYGKRCSLYIIVHCILYCMQYT